MSKAEEEHFARIEALVAAAQNHLSHISDWYERDSEEAFESAEELASIAWSLEGRLKVLLDLQSSV
jgi:hypothetical protein